LQRHPFVTGYRLFRRAIANAVGHKLPTQPAAVGIVAFGLLRTTIDARRPAT
jgi:hypothetical protein